MQADVAPRRRLSLSDLRERTEGRTVAAGASSSRLAGMMTVGALILAWTSTYVAGGSMTALPHAFYVPVIVAAIRFGAVGVFIVSLVAGVAVGPLMPLDVAAGTSQEPANWVARLAAFAIVGQLTAHLSRYSLPSLADQIAARRFRAEVAEAIADGQLRMEYQPVIDLQTCELAAVEALIRWDHPTRGLVPPDQFICAAERLGGIEQITRWVIASACAQVGEWRRGPLSGVTHFGIAVNVSALDLDDDGFAQFVGDTLQETGVPGCWLHLEITETALVSDIAAAVDRLMNLRLLGIRLAIDDFGTGTSSLSHLHRFPVDTLKLDRSFLDRLEDEERGDVVALGIVDLAERLGLTTVAEGIETPTQAQAIRTFGCSHGQGYLFSRPLRPDAMERVLRDRDGFRHLAQAASRRFDDGG